MISHTASEMFKEMRPIGAHFLCSNLSSILQTKGNTYPRQSKSNEKCFQFEKVSGFFKVLRHDFFNRQITDFVL